MAMTDDGLKVQSHVGRDLLQNAAYFSTIPKVVWEYVSNSIDNPGHSESVTVAVSITKEHIQVTDNGSGMSRIDLQRFFQMHGENIRRKEGKKVRGRFGTGKCAAFGVAKKLRIETVKDGRLNVVELDREDIEQSSGGEIPVRDITRDANTTASSGTTVLVSRLQTGQLEVPGTISYVQRHLGRQQQKHTVVINNHVCERDEPVEVRAWFFDAPPEVAEHLGKITAAIRLAAGPLDAESAGLDIFSYGNWHDTTLAEHPMTDVTRRIFGEVEVPALEDYDGPFPPFDNTRNNTLSRQNPLVVTLFGWLSSCIVVAIGDVNKDEADRKRSAEAKALRVQVDKLQQILNDDFRSLQLELEKARRSIGDAAKVQELVGIGPRDSDSQQILPDPDGDTAIDVVAAGVEPADGNRLRVIPSGVGDIERPGSGLLPGEGLGLQRAPIERPRKSNAFRLDFLNETESAHRSRYDRATRTIVINLDHSQLRAALALGGREGPGFRQLAYELAIVEYAMALGVERVERDDFYGGEDALYEIRETIHRISRRLGDFL
jgi:hypothetical protein